MINSELKQYIESEIIPRYDSFDAAHRRDHVTTVIEQSAAIMRHYDVNEDMVYAIAAYHDTGLVEGRKLHHTASGRIIREDAQLRRWFSEEQIEIMAQAAEDHRASSETEPRSIYGRIVAEADRVIDSTTILRRTIQYTLSHHVELDREAGYERMLEHLHEKYYYGGYLKLWIPESANAQRLEELRQLIDNTARLRELYDKLYDEECNR
ncbi:MAG: HD domain-containing protein [Alistipes sp.]|nr:HD domain-containing protein [Alistipes sp.]